VSLSLNNIQDLRSSEKDSTNTLCPWGYECMRTQA
jgi:hypothetical protein